MGKRAFQMMIAAALVTVMATTLTLAEETKSQAKTALPRSITFGTHAIGSVYFAVGSGVASVLTKYSGMEVVVSPHPGPVAWVGKMARRGNGAGDCQRSEVRWMYDLE